MKCDFTDHSSGTPSKFCPKFRDWSKLRIPNLGGMFCNGKLLNAQKFQGHRFLHLSVIKRKKLRDKVSSIYFLHWSDYVKYPVIAVLSDTSFALSKQKTYDDLNN